MSKERKKKIITDLREWISSKKKILAMALDAAETDKDKEYLDGVGNIYNWLDLVINDYEAAPEDEDIQIVGNLINHTSGRILNLDLDLKYYIPEDEKNIKSGNLAAYREILNFCREMRRSFNEDILSKYDREGNKWRPKKE